jgi:hypothetical protein
MVSPDRSFLDKIPFYESVWRDSFPVFFNSCHFIPVGKERTVMDFTEKPGDCRSS